MCPAMEGVLVVGVPTEDEELSVVLTRPSPLLVGAESSSGDHTEGHWDNPGLKRRKKRKKKG